MNPLVDLTKLSDNDLDAKIQDLGKKYFMTVNAELRVQITNLITMYRIELQERRARTFQEQFEKNKDKGLDNLVNIN